MYNLDTIIDVLYIYLNEFINEYEGENEEEIEDILTTYANKVIDKLKGDI